MNLFSAFVVWLIIWWLTLFIILPIGVRGQAEENDIVEGTEPGAPHRLDMRLKTLSLHRGWSMSAKRNIK